MAIHNPVPGVSQQLIDELLRSPSLPQLTHQLQAVLEAESARRRQFYDQVSDQQKAEFINGEVIVHSPVRLRHSQVSENLFSLLQLYVRKHALGHVGHEKLLIALTRNDYEPDICFFGKSKAAAFTPDQTKFPAPDLAVEVLSPSTEEIDRDLKFKDYALHQVAEYWIIDPTAETVEQYLLHESEYTLEVKVNSGTIRTRVVEGFEIPVRAIFDDQQHLAAMSTILSGAEE
jgi:Uma2 family endonuclease